MRRRITLAILGTVAAALVLAGFGTVALERVTDRRSTLDALRSEAQAVVSIVGSETAPGLQNRARLRRIVAGLRLEDIAIIAIGPQGGRIGQLPSGVQESDLMLDRLRNGETLSGRHGQLLYAMAADVRPRRLVVAVLTRHEHRRGVPTGWFLVASGITLLVGAAVALQLSRSLTRPLRRADEATRRIAAGDLSVRLPEPPAGATDELADLARSINAMAAGLERSRGLERQFLLSVSHDLRTPLTSIRGYAEAITDGTAVEPTAAATVILSESRRLERLVRDLLDLARLESNQFSFDLRPMEVSEVATDTAEGFRHQAEAAGIELVVVEDPARTVARVDPDRLAQVVANLVENGLKHATSAVRVDTVPFAGGVAVVVADDGPGIAARDLPFVFERLYVARHQPAGVESSSGLGLAIVRELVTSMGGTVQAESPVGPGGNGTRLVVRFPLP